jgi:hypothetical protein
MTRLSLVVAAASAWLAFGPQPAAADYYGAPWCAVVAAGDGDMQWHCEYQSIEACRPNVLAGNRGWCHQNPYTLANKPLTIKKRSKQRTTANASANR